MQKLLDYLKTPEQMALLISALRNLTHILAKCSGGQFLLARCFCLFPEELNKVMHYIYIDPQHKKKKKKICK
jgi:hypothetical protein